LADVNAEIGVNVDTSGALAQLKALQREISRFHTSVAKSSDAAALAQRDLQKNFINGVNAIKGFSAELRTVKTTAENFTDSLERNKFSMREYFRYSAASTKTFGRFFRSELDTVNKVAVENVKRLQTQYIKMGRDASGAMKAIAIMPTQLDMTNLATKTQLAAQKQAIFNQLVKQGSTNLLNFGKNTQWAGRQLMVGFTIPLIALGSAAVKSFNEMEAAAIKFKKVYGDLFTAPEETQFALESIQMLGKEFTKYGIAVSQTVGLAAEAAAAGFSGADLQAQVTQATRLQVLGQVEQQKALETTISLQNAFRISSNDLADAINFLNAVENQTVVSLDDITTAIPKAAPIVRELGGDVRDLAFFMAAMKEGGINASQGANALKSGLASLINPSSKAKAMLGSFGIDIDKIVEKNVGNLKATVVEFAEELDGLSNLSRQRAIEQLFGKFQQARLSALFDNVIKDGNQASRVLDLASASMEDLASLAEKELGITADSAMNKFRQSIESIKLSLVPVGEAFLEVLTPLLGKLNTFLEWFSNLSDGTKKVITKIVFYLGALAPVLLMTIGLLSNFVANGVKGLMLLRNGFLRLTGQSKILGEQTNFLSVEQQNAVAAAASLEQSHVRLEQVFSGEAIAARKLIAEYQRMIGVQNLAVARMPGMMMPGFKAKKYAKGVVEVPGPKGAGDIIPAMLSPGESVLPADVTKRYAPLIQGMIAGSIPGFAEGVFNVGGQSRTLDMASKGAMPGIQKMIDSTLNVANGVTNSSEILEEVFARLGDKTKVTIDRFIAELDMVTSSVNKKRLPASVFEGAGRERRYKGPQSIASQIKGNEVLTQEFSRASGSAEAARKAQEEFLIKNGQSLEANKEVLAQGGSVQRAHIVELQDQTDKLFKEAWDPDLWVAQAAPLNQISNLVSDSFSTKANQQVYLEKLLQLQKEGLIDEQQMLGIQQKITKGVALTDKELVIQKEVLKRILASTTDMARVTQKFGVQAAGAIGATTYLENSPAPMGSGVRLVPNTQAAVERLNAAKYSGNIGGQTSGIILRTPEAIAAQRAGETVGNAAVVATARGAGTDSPSRKTIPIGEDIDRGLEIGMMNRADDVARVAGTVASGAVSSMRNTGILDSKGNPVFVPNINVPQQPNVITDPNILDDAYAQNAQRDKQSGKTKRFGKVRGMVGKGASKISGAGGGFGLSGLLFGLSMLPGKFGKLAQSIMPVVFGLQGLKMVVSILGGWPTMLLAVGVGLFALNKSALKAAEELTDLSKKEAEARYGSVKSIEEFSEFTGRALPSAREFSRNNRQLISASGEAVKRFAEFYGQKGNRATAVINQAAVKGPEAGIKAAAVDIAQRAAIFGLSPADIAANIKAASDLIGEDQVKLKMAIQSILSPDGKDITKEPLTIQARMEFLRQDSKKKIESINKQIFDVSKISIPKSATNFFTSNFGTNGKMNVGETSYQTLKKAAGLQKSINNSYSANNVGGDLMGAAKQTGRFLSGYYDQAGLITFDAMGEFDKVQKSVQSATTQLSISFTQQTESLALLNAQYSDGLITKEEYDAQMVISSENFVALGDATESLIKELNKVDKSGELSAAALKDMGNQAFAALKKTNPELFKKITKSLQELDQAAQVDIMMGYAQGSLTLLDVARLPALLDSIDGKTVEAAIKILAEAGIGPGVMEDKIRDRLRAISGELLNIDGVASSPDQARSGAVTKQTGPEAEAARAKLKKERAQLKKDLAKIEASKKVNKTGALDTDNKDPKSTDDTGDDKFKAFEKELRALQAKRDALKDVNSELDRQNQYQMRQMDLINQASKAKISGNYLEAAALQQQSMFEGAKFTRESQEVQISRLIELIEGRKVKAEDRGRYNKGDLSVIDQLKTGNYQSLSPMPLTPKVGFNAGALGFSGATTTIGGAVYTITMNLSGVDANNVDKIKDAVLSAISVSENKKNKTNKVAK
jgi:TP901 family phage tail tape measure protein